MIYLDNAATTMIDPDVLDAMIPYLKDEYGNAGSVHNLGRAAAAAVQKAREQVAWLINCDPEKVVFTSGGTEGNNLAIYGSINYLKENNKRHIIISNTEHDSVMSPVRDLCIKSVFYSTFLKANRFGRVSCDDLINEITNETGLVSVMYVNNEVGSSNPVADIGCICRERGVLFHTDCVQAVGSRKIDVQKIGCDMLTISSHKIHGPKGVGALYIRDPEKLSPIIRGGSHQELGMRGGTENVAGIVGFGKACEILKKTVDVINVHTYYLSKIFMDELISSMQQAGLDGILHVNAKESQSRPYGKTLSLKFDGIDGETLLLMLDGKGVCVSSGSACRSHESKPSNVLTSIGVDEDGARGTIRVSFSKMNTMRDALVAARIIVECIITIRSITNI